MCWRFYIFIHLRLNYITIYIFWKFWMLFIEFILEMGSKFVTWPYIVVIFLIFVHFGILIFHKICDNAIIRQMRKFIGIFGIVCFCCKSDVAVFKCPDSKRIPIWNKNPLPYIKLFAFNYERIFNVFLNNPCWANIFLDVHDNWIKTSK